MAISTTGDEHRLGFLETCVAAWRAVLPLGSVLVITVDGDAEAVKRVESAVDPTKFGTVWQVGQRQFGVDPYNGRLGVAVNKNTGIELLDEMRVDHMFLCDDDTYPLHPEALGQHTLLGEKHSIVAWGRNRLARTEGRLAVWKWPRGVVLYAHRDVIDTVGGMVEAFGPGGHEHVEWSNRIHNAGLTSNPHQSPLTYSEQGAFGARRLWHAEDMPRVGERDGAFAERKRANTTVHHTEGDWTKIDAVMAAQVGSSAFVPFRARANGRTSATLSTSLKSQGA